MLGTGEERSNTRFAKEVKQTVSSTVPMLAGLRATLLTYLLTSELTKDKAECSQIYTLDVAMLLNAA